MTFDEFVAEWRRQVREYGSGVPQEAIDMAEQAWEVATEAERVAAELRCAKTPVLIEGHHEYTALKVQQMVMEAVSMRSNAEAEGRP